LSTHNLKPQGLDAYVNPLFWGGLLLGLLLSLLYAEHQVLTGDQTQMLYKGYLGALQGTWLSYGNAASAVGNVPGSLSAYLVGLPLTLWYSPYAPMLLLLAMRLVSYLLFDNIIQQLFAPRIRLLFMLLYWLNPWFMYENLLYNPSYLFLFAAMHFWSAFHLRQKPSFFHTLIHVLAIGMAMQLHYSWPILAVISASLVYRRLIRIHWLGLAVAVLLIAASLIPYLQELMSNQAISHNADPEAQKRYIGWGGVHVYPVLKAFIYWFRYGSWLFAGRLIDETHFAWITSVPSIQLVLTWIWRVVVYAIGALSVVLSLKANWFVWKQVKGQWWRRPDVDEADGEQWFALYGVAALFAIFISAVLSPIIFSYWHLMIAFPFALIPLLLFIRHWAQTQPEKRLGQALLLAALYCLCVNLVAANDSRKFSYRVSFKTQTEAYVTQQQQQGQLLPKAKNERVQP
jgi:hypothetical protein